MLLVKELIWDAPLYHRVSEMWKTEAEDKQYETTYSNSNKMEIKYVFLQDCPVSKLVSVMKAP